MKIKKNNLILLISFLILLFSGFLYFSFKPYNYQKDYNIDKYKIKESYDTKSKSYKFIITGKDEYYIYQINSKYYRERSLIDNINIYNNKNEICILPESKKIDFYPLCNKDDEIYSYNLSNIKTKFNYPKIEYLNKQYDKININYLSNNDYLLYNYKGFYYISENKLKNINLFNKDVYNLDLVYQFENYLIIPDYNQNFYYDTLYKINLNNGKVNTLKLDIQLSFEGLFLGDYKGWVYYLDKKEKKEYKINITKNKVEEIDFVILKKGKLEEVTYNKIINNKLLFDNNSFKLFKINDNILYKEIAGTKIKVSNNNITKIIKEENGIVYYLSNSNLYLYNDYYGEVLLLSNFEWNFNDTNMIFFS